MHALQAICAFDLLANNADRKSGHCLLGEDGHIWGIDHGLCFHDEPKLRTVIWEFGGEPVPDELMDAVGAVRRRAAGGVVRRPARRRRARGAHRPRARPSCADRCSRRTGRATPTPGPSCDAPTTSNAELVELGDLDELTRHIDRLCAAGDWDGWSTCATGAGARSSGASSSGRRRRTPSTASRSRRRRGGPARCSCPARAASLSVRSPRWRRRPTPGPSWPRASRPDRSPPSTAHERVLRGEDLTRRRPHRPAVLELPLVLQPWEPAYPLATYEAGEGATSPPWPLPQLGAVEATTAAAPRRRPGGVPRPRRAGDGVDDRVGGSGRGRRGRRRRARRARRARPRPRPRRARSPPAMRSRRWRGPAASGGAHGRRRGMAPGRFAAWWAVAALAGRLDDVAARAGRARRRRRRRCAGTAGTRARPTPAGPSASRSRTPTRAWPGPSARPTPPD